MNNRDELLAFAEEVECFAVPTESQFFQEPLVSVGAVGIDISDTWDPPSLFLEPVRSLNFEQLKTLRQISELDVNLLEIRRRFMTGKRELLYQEIPADELEEAERLLQSVGLMYSIEKPSARETNSQV
ncbi:MAG: hypothetical protein K1Y36_08650 [Blastocatellia bacterium]|nr:hypothetical protein [Blastocatellia bacterium]